ncbi:MAG: TIGR02300 family protein [Aestuariivita sp.]|nr:TIGR02300 family protein [Aestuariivita sp.]
MAKEKWGVKRVCPTTGKRFYDLGKETVISPYTGEEVEIETAVSRLVSSDEANTISLKSKRVDVEDEAAITEDGGVNLDDDLLEDDDDGDNVSLEEISNLSADEDE